MNLTFLMPYIKAIAVNERMLKLEIPKLLASVHELEDFFCGQCKKAIVKTIAFSDQEKLSYISLYIPDANFFTSIKIKIANYSKNLSEITDLKTY